MAKISELPQASNVTGGELVPIVTDSDDDSGKTNKVVTVEILADGVMTIKSLVTTQTLDEAIALCKNELVDSAELTAALATKSNTDHTHNELYAEKLHTHNYVDIQGTPDLSTYVQNTQFEELSNSVLETQAQVEVNKIDIVSLNALITSLQEQINSLENEVLALQNRVAALESK